MGKTRDVQASVCLPRTRSSLDPIRFRVRSHIAGLWFPSTEPSPLVRLRRIRHRLYQDTFHINCLPPSVSLGSKLINTAPHDHYNWLSRLCVYQDFCRIAAESCLVRDRIVSNGAFNSIRYLERLGETSICTPRSNTTRPVRYGPS
jgi:hypothetical protein